MKNACFIPIKTNSERVLGKNFRTLGNRKLYEYVIENVMLANVFDDIYIDTDSEEIKNYIMQKGLKYIKREEWLSTKFANGNDLLVHHRELMPQYDYYFQLFATAPFLSANTIKNCVEFLNNTTVYDSIFTAQKKNGFYWLANHPINYQPNILPRSQDLEPIIEETTGLYGISSEALEKYRCRIGAKPYHYFVDFREAIDINVEEDFLWAEYLLKK